MEFPRIDVSMRSRTGKGPARRLRNSGRAPAVLYGHGINAVPISVSPKELVQAMSGPLRTNTVMAIHIKGAADPSLSECKAMVRDHQYDPISRQLLHVDFLAVNLDKTVHVDVPIETSGRSLGEQTGGALVCLFRSLPVECLPEKIPVSIVVDVSKLELNEMLRVRDIALPEGITAALPPETTVVLVQLAKVEVEVVEEAAEVKEGEGEGEGKSEDQKAEGDKDEGTGKAAGKSSKGSKDKS